MASNENQKPWPTDHGSNAFTIRPRTPHENPLQSEVWLGNTQQSGPAWKHTANWGPAWKYTSKWSPTVKRYKNLFIIQIYTWYAFSSAFTFPNGNVSATAIIYFNSSLLSIQPRIFAPDTHYCRVTRGGMWIQSLHKNSTHGGRRKFKSLAHRLQVLCLNHSATH
jgi:hypothetical protein